MWLAELHFAPERSVLASPLILAAAIAARTKRMKIGTAVQVLPLCHPLRLAEEVATIDQISHGRLIFGVGRSGFPRILSDLRRRLRRKPRALRRGPGDPQASPATQERFSLRAASTSPSTTSGWCRSRYKSRVRRSASRRPAPTPTRHRRAGPSDLRSPPRTGNLSELAPELVRRYREALEGRRAIPARARCSCACRSMSPTTEEARPRGAATRASCICCAISASGSAASANASPARARSRIAPSAGGRT